MNFSHREKMILQQISQNYPHYVSLEDLSDYLDVSIRTIQRDLKQLELSLKPFEVEVIKKQNKGITLKHDHLLQVVEDILMSDNIDLNQMGRVINIYQEFMLNDDFTTSNYLSEKLNVSIYTINQDIELLSELLINANIVIRKKPGVGLELEGSEKDKRNGFTHLMSYYFNQQENSYSIEKNEFSLPFEPTKIMKLTQPILFQEVKKFPFSYTDSALYDLWMYLVISLIRQETHIVEKTHSIEDLYLQVAQSIHQRISFQLGFKIKPNEVNYMATLLRSAKRVGEKIELETDTMVNLATELISYVSSSTGYYIDQSPQFLHGLITHLRPLINRLQEGVFVGNPIKEQIKEDYPQLFLSIKHYFNQHALLDINDDEIGFLTLHFGVNIDSLKAVPNIKTLVICTSGIATSRMLTKRLLDHFPQMTIIEQSSLLDLIQINTLEYDLIISTVKLNNPSFDYIHVSPMLEERDAQQIQEKVNQLLLEPKQITTKEVRIKNIDEQLDQITILVKRSKEFLKNLEILTSNYLSYESFISDLNFSESIKNDLIDKQNTFGFGLPNTNIALVHTQHEDVHEVITHIYQNRSDMILKGMANKNEKIDTLIVLLTPNDLSPMELELISFVSITLLEPNHIKLYTKENKETITQFMQNQLIQSLDQSIKKIWRK